jgi:hypothetical protein
MMLQLVIKGEHTAINTLISIIVGEHLVHENFFQVCGLGGYGPQLSIAIGKCLAERIYDLAYTSVNLRKFDMRRVMHGRRIHELFRCT